MTADERLALVWQKVERANKHIGDLNAAILAFVAINPYKIGTKRDPETRTPIYYITDVQPVPLEIPLIVGDVIQCLRTCLDHLAQQLYFVGSGGDAQSRQTSFFVAESASEYKRHKRPIARSMEGMRQDAIDALCALEPFKDGKGHDFVSKTVTEFKPLLVNTR